MKFPNIDVVVPTFNCSSNLKKCLRSIEKQEYNGQINITIIDGGSTDNTIDIAEEFGAKIFINKGQYGTGLNGARHFGETKTNSYYVWVIDSDNFIVEETVASELVSTFENRNDLNIVMPEIAINPSSNRFNKWLSLAEQFSVNQMKVSNNFNGKYFYVPDITYGITNCSLLKRKDLVSVGGYDSDFGLLLRLRMSGLSAGAILPFCHYYHESVKGRMDYLKKIENRILRFSRMSEKQLSDYYFDYEKIKKIPGNQLISTVKNLNILALKSAKNYLHYHDTVYLEGITFLMILLIIMFKHPLAIKNLGEKL